MIIRQGTQLAHSKFAARLLGVGGKVPQLHPLIFLIYFLASSLTEPNQSQRARMLTDTINRGQPPQVEGRVEWGGGQIWKDKGKTDVRAMV